MTLDNDEARELFNAARNLPSSPSEHRPYTLAIVTRGGGNSKENR